MDMQNNINNKETDNFSQIIRQKVVNHTLPVDDMAWDAIQAELKAKQTKRIIPLWGWYLGGIAAGILVLLFVLSPFNEQLNEKQMAENKTIETKDVQQEQTNLTQTAKPIDLKQETKFKTQSKKFTNKQVTTNQTQIIVTESELNIIEKDLMQKTEPVNKLINNDIVENKSSENKSVEIQKQIIDENKLASIDSEIPEWNNPLQISDDGGWGLIAAVGSSNGSSTNQISSPVNVVAQKYGIVRAPTINTSILTPADFPDKSYNAPLSAGLKVNKKLSRTISIQSGIIYTYLQSNFKSRNTTATLNLHYLGIPLAAQTTILNSKKFGVYASAGVMIEKGIRSIYEQNESIGNQIITTRADTNIDGLQWAVNTSVGAKYSVFKDIDIYFEPRYSYYFDNNQPISIRTAKRHVISLEAGLKLNL